MLAISCLNRDQNAALQKLLEEKCRIGETYHLREGAAGWEAVVGGVVYRWDGQNWIPAERQS